MLTEGFLHFVQVEFNDFWQKSAQKPFNETEQGLFEQLYAYFMGKEKKNTTPQERTQAYHAYKRYRLPAQDIIYYDTLEIPVGSSWQDIKTAYKTAMKKYHPDRFAYDLEKQKIAQALAQKINEAYQYFEKKWE